MADTSRRPDSQGYGVAAGQPMLAVPSMAAKVAAQRDGLGVGWLPRWRVDSLLARGELVELVTADPREPNILYVAWRGDQSGQALAWWIRQLEDPRLSERVVRGIDRFGALTPERAASSPSRR